MHAYVHTYIIFYVIFSEQVSTPTLWAGTNSGNVLVFAVTIPGGTKRTEEDVTCQLGKLSRSA
jgi:lethal(2) giant larvae protein